MVADPLTLMQCCPSQVDGAAALVMGMSPVGHHAKPVQILASIVQSGMAEEARDDILDAEITARAARMAYEAAGVYDPKNKDEAIRIYLGNMPQGTSAQSAEVAYRVLLDVKDGFYRQGRLNMQGVEKVVQLRAKFGPQGKTLRPAAAYVDNSFLNAAMKRR